MQYLLLIHKEKSTADVFNNLHLAILSQPCLTEVVGVILKVDFAIRKGILCLALAVVPRKVGTYLIADIFQKIALIFQRNVCLSFVVFQTNFFDQTAVFDKWFIIVSAYGRSDMEYAYLRDESIDTKDDLRVASCTQYGFFCDFCDFDGGKNGLGIFPFVLNVLAKGLNLIFENILDESHFLFSLKFIERLNVSLI